MARRILPLLLVGLFVLASQAPAETKTVRKEVRQVFGGSQSPDDARVAAMARAKREALEEAGTYLESLTVVRNAELARDDITALASGVLQAKIVEEEPFVEGGAFGIRIVAEVRVDTSGLEERAKALLRDRGQFDQLKEVERRTRELLERVKALEAENARLGATATEAEKNRLKSSFRAETRRLTAQEWYEKGLALWDRERRLYEAPDKAVEYFTRAISLDQEFSSAFTNRGLAYRDLKQYERAIRDYDRAIDLDPADVDYNNRGNAYGDLKQYERAIRDYDRAIELDPRFAIAFNNRGVTYAKLKQFEWAIRDYDRAIKLDPADAAAFNSRGIAHTSLKKYEWAIRDFDRAIELGPRFAHAFNNRGFVYEELGQYERAIQDYDRAIQLNPIFVYAYNNRGATFYYLGERGRACRDWRKACELGDKYGCSEQKKHC